MQVGSFCAPRGGWGGGVSLVHGIILSSLSNLLNYLFIPVFFLDELKKQTIKSKHNLLPNKSGYFIYNLHYYAPMEARDQSKRIKQPRIITPNIIKMYFHGLSFFLFIEKANENKAIIIIKRIKTGHKEAIALHYYTITSFNWCFYLCFILIFNILRLLIT